MNKLYQTLDGKEFGTYLARNSSGQIVLEMKASGVVKAFNEDEIEVVMPFTYAIRFEKGGKFYHYLGKKGMVETGDILVGWSQFHDKLQMVEVMDVDTRSEAAKKEFPGQKVVTQKLDQ